LQQRSGDHTKGVGVKALASQLVVKSFGIKTREAMRLSVPIHRGSRAGFIKVELMELVINMLKGCRMCLRHVFLPWVGHVGCSLHQNQGQGGAH
jgi:hypothetical protein